MTDQPTKPEPEVTKPVVASDLSPEAKAQMFLVSAQRDLELFREKYHKTEADRADAEVRLREANKRLDALRKEKAASKPEDLDSWRQEEEKKIREEVAKDIETERSARQKLESEVKELKVVNAVFSAAKSKFNDDVQDDLKERIRRTCDIDQNGEIVVKDDKGNVRYSKANMSKPMGIQEFIEEVAELKPSWVSKTVISGVMSSSSSRTSSSAVIRRPGEGASKSEWKAYFEANPADAKAALNGTFNK